MCKNIIFLTSGQLAAVQSLFHLLITKQKHKHVDTNRDRGNYEHLIKIAHPPHLHESDKLSGDSTKNGTGPKFFRVRNRKKLAQKSKNQAKDFFPSIINFFFENLQI